ncbi:MAG: hypothetical protein ACK5V3_16060, partial [Bdellovibrionales bacterium]
VLLMHLIQQRIQQNKGLLFIDLKGDRETILKLSQFAAQANRLEDLEIFSMSDQKLSHPYNLLNGGSPTQLRDRIMCSLNWSEEYYKNQASSFLLKLMIVFCFLRDSKNLRFHIGDVLEATNSTAKIIELTKLIPENESKLRAHAQSVKDFLDSKEHFNSLQGLRT